MMTSSRPSRVTMRITIWTWRRRCRARMPAASQPGVPMRPEAVLTDTAWKKFAYEVVMDAPSEIAKRLLNGPKLGVQISDPLGASISSEQQVAWEALRDLEPQTLGSLLSWLSAADS